MFEVEAYCQHCVKKNFFYIDLFLRDRAQVEERQKERETESKAGSRLWAVSTEPDVRFKLMNREIMT